MGREREVKGPPSKPGVVRGGGMEKRERRCGGEWVSVFKQRIPQVSHYVPRTEKHQRHSFVKKRKNGPVGIEV